MDVFALKASAADTVSEEILERLVFWFDVRTVKARRFVMEIRVSEFGVLTVPGARAWWLISAFLLTCMVASCNQEPGANGVAEVRESIVYDGLGRKVLLREPV